jgi:hypothetical protein
LNNASAVSDLKLAQIEEKWTERLKLIEGQLVVANSMRDELMKRLSGRD